MSVLEKSGLTKNSPPPQNDSGPPAALPAITSLFGGDAHRPCSKSDMLALRAFIVPFFNVWMAAGRGRKARKRSPRYESREQFKELDELRV